MTALRSLPEPPDGAALAAARRYALLQPLIVDKSPLFQALVERVVASGVEPARVVELGVGTGGFLEYLAAAGLWPRASLAGADLCPARVAVAAGTMERLGRVAALIGGVNALDADDPFFHRVAGPGAADVVVLSQFEHYAPNDAASPLARRLASSGRAWCDKAALRRLAVSRLRPGGWLAVVDDYGAGTPAEQDRWDRAWDAHVVETLAARAYALGVTGDQAPGPDAWVRRYHPSRPVESRRALAARARTRRRHRDGEEVQRFDDACADFRTLFGDGNWGWVPHPNAAAHPQFRLIWGRAG